MIQERGAISLAKGIRRCPLITNLNINDNRIGAEGAIALAEVIDMGTFKLKNFECASNKLGDAQARRRNPKSETLFYKSGDT